MNYDVYNYNMDRNEVYLFYKHMVFHWRPCRGERVWKYCGPLPGEADVHVRQAITNDPDMKKIDRLTFLLITGFDLEQTIADKLDREKSIREISSYIEEVRDVGNK